MHKQPEVTEQTRNTFVSIFCDLYKQKPIEKITVKEITEIANYNRSTFYQYFKDVYEVQTHIEDELLDFVSKSIAESAPNHADIEWFIVHFIHMLSQKQPLAELLLGNPHNHHFQTRLKHEMLPLFLQIFHISSENTRTQYVFEFYIPGIVSVLSKWLQNPTELSKEELAGLIYGILQEGVISQIK